MTKRPSPHGEAGRLRRDAEEHLENGRPARGSPPSEADSRALFHELQVHQIELEMQNAELQRSRDETEAALSRYAELYDFAPVGYFTFGRDGEILSANLAGADLLGVARARLLGRRFEGFVSPGSRAELGSFLARAFEGSTRESCEVPLAREDGTTRGVRIDATVSASGKECLAAVLDVTERRAAEARLSEIESRLRRAVSEAPIPILLHDEDGRILLLSRGWTSSSGYTLEEIPTMADWTERAYGTRSGSAGKDVDALFSVGATVRNGERTVRTKDGSTRLWELEATPLGRLHGGRRVVLILAVDVTERKTSEDESRRRNEEPERRVR